MSSISSLFERQDFKRRKTEQTRNGKDASKLTEIFKDRTIKNGLPGPSSINDDLEDGEDDNRPGSEEEAPQDEEGGRFFGGGLTEEQNEVLNYVDTLEDSSVDEKYDEQWIRMQIAKVERAVQHNTRLRTKFVDKPSKFMDSEVELDKSVKYLSLLTEHTDLYKAFVDFNGLELVLTLLGHDNTDIVITTLQLLEELTDEDTEAEEKDLGILLDAIDKQSVVSSVISSLRRLDILSRSRVLGASDDEGAGVFQALNIIENLTVSQAIVDTLFMKNEQDTGLLSWMLERLLINEWPCTQNKQYCCELLSIVLQKSYISTSVFCAYSCKDSTTGEILEGVDILLRVIAPFRKSDPPEEMDETFELFQNAFDSLFVAVQNSEGKQLFIKNEGFDLLVPILKHGGSLGKAKTAKLIDHALSTGRSRDIAIYFCEAGGLGPLFHAFMSSRYIDPKYHRIGGREKTSRVALDDLLGTVSSLFRNLPEISSHKNKLLARFIERKFEKTIRLLTLQRLTQEKLEKVELIISADRNTFLKTKPKRGDLLEDWQVELEAREAEWFIQRQLDGGSRLQLIDLSIAWLLAEDESDDLGIKSEIIRQLGSHDPELYNIKKTLREFKDEIRPASAKDIGNRDERDSLEEVEQREEALDMTEMISTLIEFL
ncbi:Catenin-beta-like protein [Lipomyces oligophaga]|uniref:Catenin-beta-like protein n=1 Tax=Lipomyces oligophaga TaxID=45792 RepID=UPI0034CDD248